MPVIGKNEYITSYRIGEKEYDRTQENNITH